MTTQHKEELVEQRRLLIRLLPRLVHFDGDDDFRRALEHTEYQLRQHNFQQPFPADVHAACRGLQEAFERHSQPQKAAAFGRLWAGLQESLADDDVPELTERIVSFLLSVSRAPLSTDVDQARIDAALALCTRPAPQPLEPPPDAALERSDDEAYGAAWEEDDALSDWGDDDEDGVGDGPGRSSTLHCEELSEDRGGSEGSDGESDRGGGATQLYDQPIRAFAAGRCDADGHNGGVDFVHAGGKLPIDHRPVQQPELPLPRPAEGSERPKTSAYALGDLIVALLSHRADGALAAADATRCYSSLEVGRACLDLLQGRAGGMFSLGDGDDFGRRCLTATEAPSSCVLAAGTHTRDTTPGALARLVRPFMRAAEQRRFLNQWLRAVTAAGGRCCDELPLPAQILATDDTVCPTVAAFVTAVGQQLDVAEAAVNAIEDRLQHLEAWDTHLLGGLLLWLPAMCRPVLWRLNLLHSLFQRAMAAVWTIDAALAASVRPAAPSASPESRGAAHPERAAAASKALLDALHDVLLRTECMAGRHGRVQKGVVLHLLLAALKPTVDSIEHFLREGALFDPHAHLFFALDAAVDARSPTFWATACRLRSAGPVSLVPRCLQSVAAKVVSAGKAVMLLHTHERLFGSSAAAGTGALDSQRPGLSHPQRSLSSTMIAALDRIIIDNARLHDEAAEEVDVPAITALLARCGGFLASMHQPDETAEASLLSMVEEMDEWDADDSDGASGGLLPSQSRALVAAELDPVGVDEKVAWMHNKPGVGASPDPKERAAASCGVLEAPASPPAVGLLREGVHEYDVQSVDTELDRPRLAPATMTFELEGASALGALPQGAWGAASVVSVEGSYAHLPRTFGGRVSEPASFVAPSIWGGETAGDEDVATHAPARTARRPLLPTFLEEQAQTRGVRSEAEDSDWWEGGSQSSSDFSYRSEVSDGGGDTAPFARPSRTKIRRDLSAAEHAHLQGDKPPDRPALGEPSATAAAHGDDNTERGASDDRGGDAQLQRALEQGAPVAPAPPGDAAALPEWAAPTGRLMQEASAGMASAAAQLDYTRNFGRTRALHQVLPGGTSLPPFVPLHGSQDVGRRMRTARAPEAYDNDSAVEGSHEDALWLQYVEAEMLPPTEVLLQHVLTNVIQAQTSQVSRHLSHHLLGAWGLMAELRRVRAVLLLGAPAMSAWADHLCARLNQGITLSDGAAAKLPLFDLHVQLHNILDDALPTDPTLPHPEALSLRHWRPQEGGESARLGLALASSQSARQSLLSQMAYLDIEYTVTWPLSVVLTQDNLQRYRRCLPALLQLHWVRHNLALASKAMWMARQKARSGDMFERFVPKQPAGGQAGPRSLTTLLAADALLHMHHAVATLHRCVLDGALLAAWNDLETRLGKHAEADVDEICELHRAYLTRVEQSCLLGDDSTSRTLAHALHQLLEIALQFTQTILFLLRPSAPGQPAQPPALEKVERGNQRAAATRAVKLVAKFKQEVTHLAIVLKNRQVKMVAGYKASHFFELLNFNGYYDKSQL